MSRTLVICAFTALATGCQSDVVPVSGRVTLDGRPLAGAVVTFQPVTIHEGTEPATPGSVGRTDDSGQYTLRLIHPEKPGASIGTHAVSISAHSGGSEEAPPTGPTLPAAWTDGSKQFNVPPGGTQQANFDIISGGKAGKKTR